MIKWQTERRRQSIPDTWLLDGKTDFAAAFPVHPLDAAVLQDPPKQCVQAHWMGHASVLVQMEGVSLLTDPVFSERCSPVQWMGPR